MKYEASAPLLRVWHFVNTPTSYFTAAQHFIFHLPPPSKERKKANTSPTFWRASGFKHKRRPAYWKPSTRSSNNKTKPRFRIYFTEREKDGYRQITPPCTITALLGCGRKYNKGTARFSDARRCSGLNLRHDVCRVSDNVWKKFKLIYDTSRVRKRVKIDLQRVEVLKMEKALSLIDPS